VDAALKIEKLGPEGATCLERLILGNLNDRRYRARTMV
jgi:hypothetical protein